MPLKYRVNVESMGPVYEGPNHIQAANEFFYYSRESREQLGNAAGKRVQFQMVDGSAGVLENAVYDPAESTVIPRV